MTQVFPPPSGAPAGGQPEPDGPMPARGELGLKDRRSWKSWQLALAMLAALLIGFALNYKTVGASSGNQKAYTLPPAASTTTTSTTLAGSTTGGSTATTTTVGGGPTTATVAGGSTTTTVATGPAQVLLAAYQAQGNFWTSTPFTTTVSRWMIKLGLIAALLCHSGPAFQVFVTPVGGGAVRGRRGDRRDGRLRAIGHEPDLPGSANPGGGSATGLVNGWSRSQGTRDGIPGSRDRFPTRRALPS